MKWELDRKLHHFLHANLWEAKALTSHHVKTSPIKSLGSFSFSFSPSIDVVLDDSLMQTYDEHIHQ